MVVVVVVVLLLLRGVLLRWGFCCGCCCGCSPCLAVTLPSKLNKFRRHTCRRAAERVQPPAVDVTRRRRGVGGEATAP